LPFRIRAHDRTSLEDASEGPVEFSVRQGETINADALTAMFKHIIANNRAGDWRKLKREADHGS